MLKIPNYQLFFSFLSKSNNYAVRLKNKVIRLIKTRSKILIRTPESENVPASLKATEMCLPFYNIEIAVFGQNEILRKKSNTLRNNFALCHP